jgi:hypothetical protein
MPQLDRGQHLAITLDAPQAPHGKPGASILLSHHIRKDGTTAVAKSASLTKESTVDDWLETFEDARKTISRPRSIFSVPSVALNTDVFAEDIPVQVYTKLCAEFAGDVRVTGNSHFYFDLRVFVNKFLKACRAGSVEVEATATPLDTKLDEVMDNGELQDSAIAALWKPDPEVALAHNYNLLVKEDVAATFLSEPREGPSRIADAETFFPEVVASWRGPGGQIELPTDPIGRMVMALVCSACPPFRDQLDTTELMDYTFEPKMQPIEEYGTDIGWDIETILNLLLPKTDSGESNEVMISRILFQRVNQNLAVIIDQVGDATRKDLVPREPNLASTRHASEMSASASVGDLQDDGRFAGVGQGIRMSNVATAFDDAVCSEDVIHEDEGEPSGDITHRESIYYSVGDDSAV